MSATVKTSGSMECLAVTPVTIKPTMTFWRRWRCKTARVRAPNCRRWRTVSSASPCFAVCIFFSSRRRHTRCYRDWSSDVCSSDLANGQMDCEYIVAEGEHSQFEIVKHASAVGARSFVGSSGVGWFYAFEAIAVTAGLRLPVVANVGNRALDDPGAFGVEHNDALAVRDLGWLMTWVETGQEAFDAAVIAYKVAEDPRVMLPCAVSTDGAFLTHSQHLVKIPPREVVEQFLPKYDLGD